MPTDRLRPPQKSVLPRLAAILILLLAGCTPAAEQAPQTVTPVVRWNEAMLNAIRQGPPRPTAITRQLFMVHTAMYDAWTAYDETAVPLYGPLIRRPAVERTDARQGMAVSFAAYEMLTALFPAYEAETGAFTALMADMGYDPEVASTPGSPAAIGRTAAAFTLRWRENDGSNWQNNYADAVSDVYPIFYSPINSPDPADPAHLGGLDFNPNYWTPLRVPTGTVVNAMGMPVVDADDSNSFADQVFLTPHWGAVEPFALTGGNQFRPPPPPRLGETAPYTNGRGETMSGDEAYRRQFTEILQLSAGLTDEHKAIAEYWEDGPRSETPPGHWNALAHGLSWRDHHTIDDDVKMFFVLNGALLDGGIAAWEAKRHHDLIRPITAIRYLYAGDSVQAWGGRGEGTVWLLADTWRPYQAPTFVTPPFAEYVSGHSVFSGAAAAVLSAYTGTGRFYDGETELPQDLDGDGRPDLLGQHIVPPGGLHHDDGPAEEIILRWPTLQAAADEAGLSRRYGGIHIQDGDLRGRELGRQVGLQAVDRARSLWSGKSER